MAVKDAKTITYKIEIQDTGFAKVQSSAGKLNFAFKDLGKAIDAISRNVDRHTKAHGRTANVIRSEIRAVENLRDSFARNNKEYLAAELRIQSLENEYRDLTKTQSRAIIGNQSMSKGLGNVKSATGSASGAVVELGRTISDSNYGFPAMANNVQQLATQMTFVVAEQGGVVKGFKSIIKAMTGAGGVLLLFTIGVTLLEKFALNSRKVKDESDGMAEAIGKAGSDLRLFLDAAESGDLSGKQLSETIKNVNEKYKDLNISLDENGELTKESKKQIDNKILSLMKLAKANALATKAEEAYTDLVELEIKKEEDLQKIREDNSSQFIQNTTLASGEITTLEEQRKKVERNQEARVTAREKRFEEEKKEIQERLDFVKNKLNEEDLFKKTFENGGDDSVSRDAVATVSAIIPFDKELAQAQLDAIAEALDIEVGLIEAKEAKIQQINKTSLEEQQKNRLQTTIIEENKRQERLQTLDALAATTAAAATLFGEETKAGKAFGIATATIDTYIGANKALKDETIPNTFARIAAASAIVITGLANVKNILRVDETGQSSQGSSTSTPTIQAPDFNIVGASQQSQLAQTIAQAEQQPARAYVVAEDVTTAQQLDRNIIQGASLG